MKLSHIIWMAMLAAPATAAGGGDMQPGQWTFAIKMQSANIPGAPPAVSQAMRSPPRNISECIASNPSLQMQQILQEAPGCSFTSFSMTGGQLKADMRCSQRGGMMTARISGSYTATTLSATSQATVTAPIQMSASSTITGRRVGECF